MKATIHVELEQPAANVNAEISFLTLDGDRVCTASSAYEKCRDESRLSGSVVFRCEIPSLPLVAGDYKLNVGLYIGQTEADLVEDAARVAVSWSDYYGTGVAPMHGVFLLNNRWAVATAADMVLA